MLFRLIPIPRRTPRMRPRRRPFPWPPAAPWTPGPRADRPRPQPAALELEELPRRRPGLPPDPPRADRLWIPLPRRGLAAEFEELPLVRLGRRFVIDTGPTPPPTVLIADVWYHFAGRDLTAAIDGRDLAAILPARDTTAALKAP